MFSGCVGPFQAEPSPYPTLHSDGTFETAFANYRGSGRSLPPGMFVSGRNEYGTAVEDGFRAFSGISSFSKDGDVNSTTQSFDGFGAFTNGRDGYSFGIREHGPIGLQDSRLFLEYRNPTERTIIGFRIRYHVELWYLGERDNRIRLKYNTDTGGFSELADIVSTANPRLGQIAQGLQLDGSLEENRAAVDHSFILSELQTEEGETAMIPDLLPGGTAYFRWQYSNGEIPNGELRSALALNNITIEPLFAPESSNPEIEDEQ
ncbi:hypothetical protein JCM12856_21340 [Spirochaeta dissipatitropha]